MNDKYIGFNEPFTGRNMIDNFDTATRSTSKIIDNHSIFQDSDHIYRFTVPKSQEVYNTRLINIRHRLPNIFDKAISLSPKYANDWENKKKKYEKIMNTHVFQSNVNDMFDEEREKNTEISYKLIVDQINEDIPKFQELYPDDYQTILDNTFVFNPNYMDTIPKWSDLYLLSLSNIMEENNIYFISACRG